MASVKSPDRKTWLTPILLVLIGFVVFFLFLTFWEGLGWPFSVKFSVQSLMISLILAHGLLILSEAYNHGKASFAASKLLYLALGILVLPPLWDYFQTHENYTKIGREIQTYYHKAGYDYEIEVLSKHYTDHYNVVIRSGQHHFIETVGFLKDDLETSFVDAKRTPRPILDAITSKKDAEKNYEAFRKILQQGLKDLVNDSGAKTSVQKSLLRKILKLAIVRPMITPGADKRFLSSGPWIMIWTL